jgi:protein Mpv17
MQAGSVTLRSLWKLYTHLITCYPKATKITTGTLITALGDLICQHLLEGATHLDGKRVEAVSSYGAVVSYVEGHVWLGFLERAVGTSMSVRSSLYKTILDQGLFAPLETSGFMAWTHYHEGHKTSLEEKLKADLPTALCCSYFFWGPVCMLEFLFVPYPLRVLYISTMSVAWDTYLSYVAHNSLQSQATLALSLAL